MPLEYHTIVPLIMYNNNNINRYWEIRFDHQSTLSRAAMSTPKLKPQKRKSEQITDTKDESKRAEGIKINKKKSKEKNDP